MQSVISNIKPDQRVVVLPETINKAIAACPRGKAAGMDCIQYEHLITAKDFLSSVLANLFTHILRLGHMPDKLKMGCIITLHKGGNKRTDDPTNYRASSLTSVILKLFETTQVERSKQAIMTNLSPQQGGFQENLGVVMTSFVLRESNYFSREHHSKLYVFFLDCKQAFDRVWFQWIFYKLIECNFDPTSLIAFTELYRNVNIYVKYKGLTSETFPIQQGTRQGSKSAPLL